MKLPNIDEILEIYPEISGIHPAANLFPLPTEEEFEGLVNDIKQNGLKHDLEIDEDSMLLDGRSRLMACTVANKDPVFVTVRGVDPWSNSVSANLHRRNLNAGQRAMIANDLRAHFEEEAKQRQRDAGGDRGNQFTVNNPDATVGKVAASGNITGSGKSAGDSRDRAGKVLGVGGSTVDKARDVSTHTPTLAPKVRNGSMSLQEAHKEAKVVKQRATAQEPNRSIPVTRETVRIITIYGDHKEIQKPKSARFNRTNENVEWASWTWNPVTGCNHGCTFCYAREIANQKKMESSYPFQFQPSFHEYRLEAPKNTTVPDSSDPRDKRVFVCSMADLFGKWVPDKWIKRVFDACIEGPGWEYLFLTKWPRKYSMMPLLEDAWYGASIIQQKDVARVEKNMKDIAAPETLVRWVSLEPMLEPIKFNDLSWCDLMVIGAQTSTHQPTGFVPEFAPEFDWVVDVVNQCREFDVPYYIKPNAGRDAPGMALPKSLPRNRQ